MANLEMSWYVGMGIGVGMGVVSGQGPCPCHNRCSSTFIDRIMPAKFQGTETPETWTLFPIVWCVLVWVKFIILLSFISLLLQLTMKFIAEISLRMPFVKYQTASLNFQFGVS